MPNYNTTLQSNNSSLEEIITQLNNMPDAGGSNPVEQATPSITVNSSGLITATATQTAGYVAAGTKSATKQLAFQAAKTITPGTANQTAVSSGYYTGGAVTVKGDSNLVAGNIKSGVSIFGVTGNYVGSGSGGTGGDTSQEDGLITRELTTYTNDRVTSIGSYVFYYCSSLTTVSFPQATTIGYDAFYSCNNLTTVSFPVAASIGGYAFARCPNLTTASFPQVTFIGSNAFYSCNNLTTANFPVATSISRDAFAYCSRLSTISFPVATSIGRDAFRSCPNLTTASFPQVTFIGSNAFYSCNKLTTVSFPVATSIGSYAFELCPRLTTVSFPKVAFIDDNAFNNCPNLTTVSLAMANRIGEGAFFRCHKLTSLYLTGSSVCTLSSSLAFDLTPIGGYSASAGTYGSIYVPTSLVTAYKSATNWTYFSSRIVGWTGTNDPE